MAKLFDTYSRIVPTWLAAARYLEQQPDRMGRNLVLEIPTPLIRTPADEAVMHAVDAALVQRDAGLTLETVAGTIFPQGLYARHPRAELYAAYQRMITRAQVPHSWGTYFGRMTRRSGRDGVINPLDTLIEKIRRAMQPGTPTYQSAYELATCDPAIDLAGEECGVELGTYEPAHDMRRYRNGPCLSHLSFKITNGSHVDLTAMYRSHTYCSRALGNLIGLGRLQRFVALESGLQVGTLSCLSTHAELDLEAWAVNGGVAQGRAVMASLAAGPAAAANA